MIGPAIGCCKILLCLLSLSHRDGDTSSKDSYCQWLIVGGGLHGVHIAAQLVATGKATTKKDSIVIVDDSPQLLQKWKRRTALTGMKFMRSSSSMHLDVDVDSLRRFAVRHEQRASSSSSFQPTSINNKKKNTRHRSHILKDPNVFAPDYQRPSLALFNQHCDHVIEKYGLERLHLCGHVQQIHPTKDKAVKVMLDVLGKDGTNERKVVSAENVVLALGSDDPSFPSWVKQLQQTTNSGSSSGGGAIQHIFDVDNFSSRIEKGDSCINVPKQKHPTVHAIVGGGISAVHKALDILAQDKGGHDSSMVHIISRHPVQEQQFDTHQDWMMDLQAAERSLDAGGNGFPHCVQSFHRQESYVMRRAIIRRERKPGTVPCSLSRGKGGLNDAMQSGRLFWHVSEIERVTCSESEFSPQQALHLTTEETIMADNTILATGFGTKPPGAFMIDELARTYGLPRAPCGYPIVDFHLRWHPRIFVTGGLAELELGPSARNIAGARMASERIVLYNNSMVMKGFLGQEHVQALRFQPVSQKH